MSIVRSITSEEAAFYQRRGWVVLRGWVDQSAVAELLATAQAALGSRAQFAESSSLRSTPRIWSRWDEPWRQQSEFGRFGRSSEFVVPLLDLSGSDMGLRYIDDQVVVKPPSSAGGTRTPWHQDHPDLPIDRTGDLTVWLPLHEMRAEQGTLQFLDGSHAVGPLVHHRMDSIDLERTHPDLFARFAQSPALHLRPGDATVHHGCTIHGASRNDTGSPRWAYLAEFIPGDARVTRSSSPRVRAAGLAVGDMFVHPAFPLTRVD